MEPMYNEEEDYGFADIADMEVPSQASTPRRRRRTRKPRQLSFTKICVVVSLAFFCVQFGKQLIQFQQIQAEVSYFEQIKQEKLDKQKELERTKVLLDDPAYIERVAREHLGLIYEGETLVLPGETVDDVIPEYNPNIKAGDLH